MKILAARALCVSRSTVDKRNADVQVDCCFRSAGRVGGGCKMALSRTFANRPHAFLQALVGLQKGMRMRYEMCRKSQRKARS
jgi:hypothetical protein